MAVAMLNKNKGGRHAFSSNSRHFRIVTILIFQQSMSEATGFHVNIGSDTDCSDNYCDLQSALDAAAINHEDVTIQLG